MAFNSPNLSFLNYISGNSSQSDTTSLLQQRMAFMNKSSSGKYTMPTIADFNSATNLNQKLRVSVNLAQSVKVQTDALAQTGVTTRATAMAAQAKQAMSALETTVNGIAQDVGADGLKVTRSSIQSGLTTLRQSMVQLANAARKMSATDAQNIANTLKSMDSSAQKIAKTAGLKWSSPLGSTQNTTNTSATTTTTTPRLLDFLT